MLAGVSDGGTVCVPVIGHVVCAGFPSPARDYVVSRNVKPMALRVKRMVQADCTKPLRPCLRHVDRFGPRRTGHSATAVKPVADPSPSMPNPVNMERLT